MFSNVLFIEITSTYNFRKVRNTNNVLANMADVLESSVRTMCEVFQISELYPEQMEALTNFYQLLSTL